MTRTQSIPGLLGWLTAIYALAALAALGSADAPVIYASFARPAWAPPASVFGPAWSVLYTMMAVSAWLVWRDRGFRAASGTFALFFLQLAVNILWSWLFFAWLQGLLSFLNIILLLVLVLATMVGMWRLNHRLASVLLAPYVCWVGYASCLNFSVWQMNPTMLGG